MEGKSNPEGQHLRNQREVLHGSGGRERHYKKNSLYLHFKNSGIVPKSASICPFRLYRCFL